MDEFACLFAFDGLTRSARLPRDVREKAEDRPCLAYLLASGELRCSVAFEMWFAAADRDDLRFFTPITQRIGVVGASFRFSSLFGRLTMYFLRRVLFFS